MSHFCVRTPQPGCSSSPQTFCKLPSLADIFDTMCNVVHAWEEGPEVLKVGSESQLLETRSRRREHELCVDTSGCPVDSWPYEVQCSEVRSRSSKAQGPFERSLFLSSEGGSGSWKEGYFENSSHIFSSFGIEQVSRMACFSLSLSYSTLSRGGN